MAFRPAGPDDPDDAATLRDLERAANVVALAHVFPPEHHPFPDTDVLDRWRATLVEPGVTTLLAEDGTAYVCFDATTVRHLAVHPSSWGRGLARRAVTLAVEGIAAGGADRALLWCLRDNHRARGLYAHLGWVPTGLARRAEWEPHPVEEQHVHAPHGNG